MKKITSLVGVGLMLLSGMADEAYGPFGYESNIAEDVQQCAPTVYDVDLTIKGSPAQEGDCIAAYRASDDALCGLGMAYDSGAGVIRCDLVLYSFKDEQIYFKAWQSNTPVTAEYILDVDSSCNITAPTPGSIDVPVLTLFVPVSITTYTITYKPGTYGTGSQQTTIKTNDVALTLKSAIFTRTGYTQTGWATSDGGSKAYNLSATYTANAGLTLYPYWTANTYTVTFDRQGGSGGSASVTATYGSAMPSITVPTRNGYTFGGYWTGTNGSGTQFYSSAGTSSRTWNIANATTLYAKWTEDSGSGNGPKWTIVDGVLTAVDLNGCTEVVIPAGVTSIGNNVFAGCSDLTTVTIPNSVTNIGFGAFHGCYDLVNVSIPNNVTSIDGDAFYACCSLTNITIPASVTSIGRNVFLECSSLTSFTVDTENLEYKSISGMLMTKDGSTIISVPPAITAVTIPEGVTSIGDAAFYGCRGLTNVTIPDGVLNIGSSAFQSCSGLVGMIIPDSITFLGYQAFYGCSSLKHVTLSENMKYIGRNTFDYCRELTEVMIPAGVTQIQYNAFSRCYNLTNVTFCGNAPEIGASVFEAVSLNCVAYVKRGSTGWGVDIPGTWNGIRIEYADDEPEPEPKWTIVDGVLTAVDLNGCTDVTIPNSVTSIGDMVFNGCTGLKNVTIPNSVTNIGYVAFYACTGLTGITIPDSVTSIAHSAFINCSRLTSFSVAAGNTKYKSISGLLLTKDGSLLIAVPGGVSSVVIPNGVKCIGSCAFEGCFSLVDLSIPDSVTEIRAYAFNHCSSLQEVVISSSITNIEYAAFSGCSSLMSFTVDPWNAEYKSVSGLLLTKDGSLLVAVPGGLANVTIPYSVTDIGNGAFDGCHNITSITIPDSVKNIGGDAFCYCSSLTNVIISSGVRSIGGFAFYLCTGLSSVTIPASIVDIGEYAFASCEGLTNIVFAGNAPTVSESAFSSVGERCVAYVSPSSTGWGVDIPGTWKGIRIEYVATPCRVTLGKNGGTGGDNYVTATYGKPMPTPRTAPKLSGYTFAGYWDTLAMDEKGNPKGKPYYDANMKSVRNWDKNGAATLWAKWTNKVTLGKNGGTGGDNFVTCTKGQPMPKRTMPTKSGYVFDGYWTTTGTGGVKYYNADGTSAHTWDKSGNVTLWAKWVEAVSCKVTLGKNGGTGGDNYVTATTGKAMPTPRTAPTRTGWTFGGYWDTLACDAKGNPLGKQYYDASMKSVRNWDKTSAATLWAKWTVRVKLGKNGGTGGDDYVTVVYNQPFPKRTMPKRSGYAFGGYWVSASSKTGQCYNPDGTGTSSMKWSTGGSPTIWALWTKTSACVELPPAVAPSASAAPAPAEPAIPAGIYSGILADGTGAFWLVLDEAEKNAPRTAFLYVSSEDGSLTAECTAEEVDGILLLMTDGGGKYVVDIAAGIAICP